MHGRTHPRKQTTAASKTGQELATLVCSETGESVFTGLKRAISISVFTENSVPC